MRKYTKEEFIKRAIDKHGDRYDYSLVEYKNNSTNIRIICDKHGIFETIPRNHLKGVNCKKCAYLGISMKTNNGKSKFITKSKLVHGDKYDYSLVDYRNNKTKVSIICKEHGIFKQRPDLHLYSGCIDCAGIKKKTVGDFIKVSKEVHGDKYDYSLVDYRNNKTKVSIICKEHGLFEQISKSHLKGNGCSKCSTNYKKDINYFLKKALEIHGNRYLYDRSIYESALTKVIINCPIHGDFLQTPNKHIKLKQGCPKCRRSKGIDIICNLLDINNISYENEKTIEGCLSKNNKLLYFDISIKEKNILIEYDGEQHFLPIEKWGGQENLNNVKERDHIKDEFCKRNNIKLFRISYFDDIESKINDIISSYLL
jgi:hypothetical protein